MRHQHDHLGHSEAALAGAQELVRELGWRHQLEAETVLIEMQRRGHVVDPQHDLRETRNAVHDAIADTIAARFASLARVGTEQPGASSKPRPPVSSTACRASASTSAGGP